MADAKISPANIPNVLEKSTSLEFTYKKYTFLQSLENSLCLSAALDIYSLIVIDDACRFCFTTEISTSSPLK